MPQRAKRLAAVLLGLTCLGGPLVPASAGVQVAGQVAGQVSGQGTGQRTDSTLSRVDARVGTHLCALLGRTRVPAGCSRATCERATDRARRIPNAEVCRTPAGRYYGRPIDFRACRSLHRYWAPQVNLCVSNPARHFASVQRARQCVGAFSDYVMVRESTDAWDECVTPTRRRQLERIARETGTPLSVVAEQRSPALCALRDNTEYVGGQCRTTDPAPFAEGVGTGTLLVGDSLSWRGSNELAGLRPRWRLDAVPGRPVTQLPARVHRYLAARGAPETLVVALGTNPRTSWRKRDYVAAVALLPAETRVLFVTPYRDPAHSSARAVARLGAYDRWMREITATRPGTCLADWRALAATHPELLVDGTHQSPDGEAVWAELVSTSWEACPATD
ncbi:MAG: hypothetical protein Q7J48_17520 [Nocardioides sp.]|nr:hypothetical protein [Nocardioides sp.]